MDPLSQHSHKELDQNPALVGCKTPCRVIYLDISAFWKQSWICGFFLGFFLSNLGSFKIKEWFLFQNKLQGTCCKARPIQEQFIPQHLSLFWTSRLTCQAYHVLQRDISLFLWKKIVSLCHNILTGLKLTSMHLKSISILAITADVLCKQNHTTATFLRKVIDKWIYTTSTDTLTLPFPK